MNKIIEESGVVFGPFDSRDLFHIEKSEVLHGLGKGIKTVEFVLVRSKNQALIFLEAKQSCPNKSHCNESQTKRKKYEDYFQSIVNKIEDSIRITVAAILGRYGQTDEVGENMQGASSLGSRPLQFVLVLTDPNTEVQWLAGPKAELEKRLLSIRKTWGLEIMVINREKAEEWHLIHTVPSGVDVKNI